MDKTIRITKRFIGPPDSGNGGYTCGLVSQALGVPTEVTLRRPIPIERDLTVHMERRNDSDWALLQDSDGLIAEGAPMQWIAEQAPGVSFLEAQAAAEKSPAFRNHPFPTCFTCGPDRKPGDGLRIFPGRISTIDHLGSVENNRSNFFAATWIPDATVGNQQGIVNDEIVWAALDCPTGFAGGFPYDGKMLTGRLGANLYQQVNVDEKCVLVSWSTGASGRKRFATCVLLGEDGTVKAQSRATWIKV